MANFIATARAIAFFITTTVIAVPLFHVMLYMSPFVLMFDKFKRTAMHLVNDIWANLTTLFFYPIEVSFKFVDSSDREPYLKESCPTTATDPMLSTSSLVIKCGLNV